MLFSRQGRFNGEDAWEVGGVVFIRCVLAGGPLDSNRISVNRPRSPD